MDISSIKIQYIPALFPDIDYFDKKYIDCRVIPTKEKEIVLIRTEEKYKTVFEPNTSDNVLIQSTYNEKFYLEFTTDESVNEDTIKIGDVITITDEYGKEFKARFLNLEYTRQGDSYVYLCVFEFYKLMTDDKVVSNYLTSDYLLQRANNYTNLNYLEFSNTQNIGNVGFAGGEKYRLVTALQPLRDRTDLIILEDTDLQGNKYPAGSFDFGIIVLKFFLTEYELNQLKKFYYRCFYYDNGVPKGSVFNLTAGGSLIYTSEQPIKIDVKNKNYIGIYEVDITLYHDKVNYYNYAV